MHLYAWQKAIHTIHLCYCCGQIESTSEDFLFLRMFTLSMITGDIGVCTKSSPKYIILMGNGQAFYSSLLLLWAGFFCCCCCSCFILSSFLLLAFENYSVALTLYIIDIASPFFHLSNSIFCIAELKLIEKTNKNRNLVEQQTIAYRFAIQNIIHLSFEHTLVAHPMKDDAVFIILLWPAF